MISDPIDVFLYECLIIIDILEEAEENCRKLNTGNIAWSPAYKNMQVVTLLGNEKLSLQRYTWKC